MYHRLKRGFSDPAFEQGGKSEFDRAVDAVYGVLRQHQEDADLRGSDLIAVTECALTRLRRECDLDEQIAGKDDR